MKKAVMSLVCLTGLNWLVLTDALAQPLSERTLKLGTVVHLQAQAETYADNDEARVNFFVQEQHADRAEAASLANKKTRETIERIKQADPAAEIRTMGYSTYPQYAHNGRTITAWQVRQEVVMTTKNLSQLEKTVARVQSVAAVGGIVFALSREAQRKLDVYLFDMAFVDFRSRMALVAKALGKTEKEVEIEEINLTNTERPFLPRPPVAMMARAAGADVAETKFEPGDSRQSISFTARIRVKP
jgi:predicted secreted protein